MGRTLPPPTSDPRVLTAYFREVITSRFLKLACINQANGHCCSRRRSSTTHPLQPPRAGVDPRDAIGVLLDGVDARVRN